MIVSNNYVRHRNTRTEMYAGRVACCLLVSHVEYVPRAVLMLEKKTGHTDRRTDGRTDGQLNSARVYDINATLTKVSVRLQSAHVSLEDHRMHHDVLSS